VAWRGRPADGITVLSGWHQSGTAGAGNTGNVSAVSAVLCAVVCAEFVI